MTGDDAPHSDRGSEAGADEPSPAAGVQPDPAADLTDRLDELASQLAELRDGTAAHATDLTALLTVAQTDAATATQAADDASNHARQLAAELTGISDVVAGLVDQLRSRRATRTATVPVDWYAASPGELLAAYGRLRDWVPWFRTTLKWTNKDLAPCWYEHTNICMLLTALASSYATLHDPNGPGTGPAQWWAQLPAAEATLRAYMNKNGCTADAHAEPLPHHPGLRTTTPSRTSPSPTPRTPPATLGAETDQHPQWQADSEQRPGRGDDVSDEGRAGPARPSTTSAISVSPTGRRRNGSAHHPEQTLAAASDPATTPEDLKHFATDPNFVIRRAVARNPATPRSVLLALVNDREPAVRLAIATRTSTTPGPILAALAKDDSPDVRSAAGQHPDIPPRALTSLTGDADPEVAEHVRTELARRVHGGGT